MLTQTLTNSHIFKFIGWISIRSNFIGPNSYTCTYKGSITCLCLSNEYSNLHFGGLEFCAVPPVRTFSVMYDYTILHLPPDETSGHTGWVVRLVTADSKVNLPKGLACLGATRHMAKILNYTNL